MQKTIMTHMQRKFTVEDDCNDVVVVSLESTGNGGKIVSRMINADAVDLGTAVLNAAGKKVFTYEGSLPGVGYDNGFFVAGQGNHREERRNTTSSESVMKQIKALIAIHQKLVAEEEYRASEEYKRKEAERKLNERRNALVNKFAGTETRTYSTATDTLREAVDYAIELEDKLTGIATGE